MCSRNAGDQPFSTRSGKRARGRSSVAVSNLNDVCSVELNRMWRSRLVHAVLACPLIEKGADLQTRFALAPTSMELRCRLSCTKGGCQFVTPMDLALAMEYLKLHVTQVHGILTRPTGTSLRPTQPTEMV